MKDTELIERLDAIITLLIPKYFEDHYEFGGLPLQVMELCDFDHSVQDMMKKLKKSRPVIDNALSKLRKDGFIKSMIKDDKTVYIRLR